MKNHVISLALLFGVINTSYSQGLLGGLLGGKKKEENSTQISVSNEELLKIPSEPQQKVAKLFFEKYGTSKFAYITSVYAGSDTYRMEIGYEWNPQVGTCNEYKFKDNSVTNDSEGGVSSVGINYQKGYGGNQNSCYAFALIHPTGAYAFGNDFMSEKYIDGTKRCYSHLVTFFENFILFQTEREDGKFFIGGDFYLVGNSSVLKQLLKTYKSHQDFKNAINPILQKYYDDMQVLLKQGDAKAEKTKRDKYGIQGKDVVSLAIEPSQYNKVFQGQTFNFDIIATLKDGSKLSTRQGFLDEYEIKVEGLEKIEHKDVDGKVSVRYEITKTYIPAGDKIKITAKSKYHSGVKPAEFTTNVDYENCEWVFSDNGDQSSTEAYRKSAGNYRIEVKSSKDLNKNIDCYEYKVFARGEFVAHCKQVKTKPISVSAKGGDGKKPNFGKQNGGNGGSITLIKDPGAKECKIIYNVNGGKAFDSGYSNGSPGTYTEMEQKLSW